MKKINYKGKGEHCINELEKIIEQREEELHLIKTGEIVLNLPCVTQQRGLFYNFITWYNAKPRIERTPMIYTSTIEEYLKL